MIIIAIHYSAERVKRRLNHDNIDLSLDAAIFYFI